MIMLFKNIPIYIKVHGYSDDLRFQDGCNNLPTLAALNDLEISKISSPCHPFFKSSFLIFSLYIVDTVSVYF